MSARFAIHMESGVVVALTSETKGNYLYQEITPKVARAIADKKVSPQWVIEQIMAKMPRSQLREKLKLEAQLNVRQVDFGLRDAARASADLGEENAIDISLPGEGEKKGNKKGATRRAIRQRIKRRLRLRLPRSPMVATPAGRNMRTKRLPAGKSTSDARWETLSSPKSSRRSSNLSPTSPRTSSTA